MRTDKYALLIAGSKQDHSEEIQVLYDYLTQHAGFSRSRVSLVQCSSPKVMLDRTSKFFDNVRRESSQSPVVVSFTGEGSNEGFNFPQESDHSLSLPYNCWVKRLSHQGPLFLLMHMCYSGSIIPVLMSSPLFDPATDGVITSCGDSERSCGVYFTEQLIRSFSQGKVFTQAKVDIPPLDYLISESTSWDFTRRKFEIHRVSGTGEVQKRFVPFTRLPKRLQKALPSRPRATRQPDGSELYPVHIVLSERKVEVIQHPVRFGASLDYLLFKQ